MVFPSAGVAVFIDGDFWHGYRFPSWETKLTPKWRDKIAYNCAKDRRNHQKLRRWGWAVVRVWEHEIEEDIDSAVAKITAVLPRN